MSDVLLNGWIPHFVPQNALDSSPSSRDLFYSFVFLPMQRCSNGHCLEEMMQERNDRHALQGRALLKEAGRENTGGMVLQLPLLFSVIVFGDCWSGLQFCSTPFFRLQAVIRWVLETAECYKEFVFSFCLLIYDPNSDGQENALVESRFPPLYIYLISHKRLEHIVSLILTKIVKLLLPTPMSFPFHLKGIFHVKFVGSFVIGSILSASFSNTFNF
jgi:hypothetical protein